MSLQASESIQTFGLGSATVQSRQGGETIADTQIMLLQTLIAYIFSQLLI